MTAARGLALLVVTCCLVVSRGQAQQATVQGIVTDSATAQPLGGAIVTLEQGGRLLRSERTDGDGFYQISGLAPGAYQLHIVSFGYIELNEAIDLAGGERLTANRGLGADPLQLQGVSFQSPPSGAVERDLGRQIITARDLSRVPTPAASGDLVTYLQTMPGVIATGDRGGQLLIRGGTPSENLVLMDGLIVYQPFHITGFFSVFPEELIGIAEFYPGGFGAQYSGRTSSVLDVQMRDGDRNQRSVAGSISPFVAELTAEGPLGAKGGNNSVILSLRRSMIEETSPWLLGEEQPLQFGSYYFTLSTRARDGSSRCSATGLLSEDQGGLDPAEDASRLRWANLAFGGRCASLFGDIFLDARLGISQLESEAFTRGVSSFKSTASRLKSEGNASFSVGRMRLAFGAFGQMEDANYDAVEFLSRKGREFWLIGMGAYGEAILPIGTRFRLLPGVAFNWNPDSVGVAIEPRLRASWQPRGRPNEQLSAAVGVYQQQVAGITDRRDASSVFTFWTRAPVDAQIRNIHAQASWQQRIGAGLSWSIDAFYRRMVNLPVTTWSPVASFNTNLSLADGRAHGFDSRAEFRRGPLYAFLGYGYSWIEYRSAQDAFGTWFDQPVFSYHPGHDRRHQLNTLASLNLDRFRIAARWEYGSGFPFTRPHGFDEQFDFRTSLPNVRRTFGETRVLVDRPFNGRLPAVHRLDLSMERTFTVRSRQLQLQAGVINAYDRQNMFYYDVFTRRRIDQLPFAPYASLKLDTRRTPR